MHAIVILAALLLTASEPAPRPGLADALWKVGSAPGDTVWQARQADSLDLARALALARARSPVMAAAWAGVEEAAGLLTVARAASRPRIEADGLYLRYQDPPAVSFGPLGAFAMREQRIR